MDGGFSLEVQPLENFNRRLVHFGEAKQAAGSLVFQSVIAGDTQLTFGTPPSVLTMVQAALAREGTEVATFKSPAPFASFLAEDEKFWVKLVKDAAVKL